MKNKYIVIVGGILLLGFSLMSFSKAKISQAKELVKELLVSVSLPKNIKAKIDKVWFDMDIILKNPTAQDFSVSQNIVIGKAWRIYLGKELIANGSLNNMKAINLRAGGKAIFPISVEIPTMKLTTEISKILTNTENDFSAIKGLITGKLDLDNIDWEKALKNLNYQVDLEGFGMIHKISNSVF